MSFLPVWVPVHMCFVDLEKAYLYLLMCFLEGVVGVRGAGDAFKSKVKLGLFSKLKKALRKRQRSDKP